MIVFLEPELLHGTELRRTLKHPLPCRHTFSSTSFRFGATNLRHMTPLHGSRSSVAIPSPMTKAIIILISGRLTALMRVFIGLNEEKSFLEYVSITANGSATVC